MLENEEFMDGLFEAMVSVAKVNAASRHLN